MVLLIDTFDDSGRNGYKTCANYSNKVLESSEKQFLDDIEA